MKGVTWTLKREGFSQHEYSLRKNTVHVARIIFINQIYAGTGSENDVLTSRGEDKTIEGGGP